jgi:DNA-binding FadR family transcriptional regulator
MSELRALVKPGAAASAAKRCAGEDVAVPEAALADMVAAGHDGGAFISPNRAAWEGRPRRAPRAIWA